MAELNTSIGLVVDHFNEAFCRGHLDEKSFRALIDVCQAAASVPSLKREIFDLKLELGAVEGELQEIKDSGEIIDD